MKDTKQIEDKILERLDLIVELLQTQTILQSTQLGMNKKDIRKLLKVSMNRVTAISKLLKKD